MGVIKTLLTIIYVIMCLVLIVICLMQSKDDEGASGTIMGGGSTSFTKKIKVEQKKEN